MTARTPAQLKGDMPAGVPGGTNVADMHNLVDSMAARTTFSVKEFGAVGTDNIANAAADTQAFLDATAAAAASNPGGAGAVYVPSGVYYVNPNVWSIPSRTKVFGDGYTSKVRKAANGWLINISGTETFTGRNSYCILRDLQLDGNDKTGAILQTYYGSEILVDKVRFYGNSGVAVDAVELWDSRFQNCFFDWCGTSTIPAIQLRNSASETAGVFGYGTDCTNAVYFYGCRWESFKAGAILIERGTAANTDSPSQLFFVNCKMETSYLNGSLIRLDPNGAGASVVNVHFDQLFISINSFNAGYSTPTDVIDWRANNSCSLRNVWCYVGQPGLVRTVVKATLSFNTCTLENIIVGGNKPTVGVVETLSTSEPKMLGYIGGNSNSMEAIVNARGTGLTRALTAARAATQLDNGIMYTTNVAGDIVVTLPDYTSPGWTCQALQLHATGTITFQPVSGSGTTFIHQNGADHRRTGGQHAIVDVRCVSNNSTMNAAVFHVRGKTVAAV